jgi:hypothetical protein
MDVDMLWDEFDTACMDRNRQRAATDSGSDGSFDDDDVVIRVDGDGVEVSSTDAAGSSATNCTVGWKRNGRPLRSPSGRDTDDAHANSAKPIALQDGTVHWCRGFSCPHATVDEHSHVVCELTGVVVGIQPSTNRDTAWTGRSISSCNPDDSCGVPVGGWRKRQNMLGLSVMAYKNAHLLSDAEVEGVRPGLLPSLLAGASSVGAASSARADRDGRDERGSNAPADPLRPKPATKRGALCVQDADASPPRFNEDDAEPAAQNKHAKKHRVQRRLDDNAQTTVHKKLKDEAFGVVGVLLSCNHIEDERTATRSASQHDQQQQPPHASSHASERLKNVEYVLRMALKKMVAEARTGSRALNLSGVHDVCLRAHQFVREQRTKAQAEQAASADACKTMSGISRSLCVELIVELWLAASETPHMKNGKKGADSFRSFAAGVLYGFKRGNTLRDGTVIVPKLPQLTDLLPTLRSTTASATARQLQSSSHAGICSLHRSIASVAHMSAEEYARSAAEPFRRASLAAVRLEAYFKNGGR